MSKIIKTSFLLIVLIALTGQPGTVKAQKFELNLLLHSGFNPNYLLSDYDLTNYAALAKEDIQKFLESKSGVLAKTDFMDIDGQIRPASEIIFRANQNYHINAQVILTILQKEQSLIDNPRPSQYDLDWATGYGRCDACDPNDPAIAKFKGLAKQVDSAAGALRYYLDNLASQNWLKRPGIIYNIDTIPVIPANWATASLYSYTPHFEGNYNFWKIWQKWFNQLWPDGSLIQAKDDDKIWLIQGGLRRLFATRAAFFSRFDAKKVLIVSAEEIANFKEGPAIKYPNFSLLKSKKGDLYLLVNDKKRLIDKQSFRYFGFNAEEIIKASDEDLAAYFEAEPIVKEKKYPLGILMQDNKSGGVYYVADNVKYPIWDRQIITNNFNNLRKRPVSPAALNKFETGEAVKFNDGALLKLKDSAEVYFVSNGKRRLITDMMTFQTLGWQEENIITTTEKILNLHPLDEPISLPPTASASLTLSP